MSKMRKTCRLAALLALIAPASMALAAQGPLPGQHLHDRFAQMDANNDGKIAIEEFRSSFPNMNEKAFLLIDVNGDGAIDKTEWLDFMEGHAKSGMPRDRGAQMNNIPGDPLIPPVDSNDLPLMRPPGE